MPSAAELLENQPDSSAQAAPARHHLIDMVAHDLANGLAGIRLSAAAYLRRRDRSDAATTRYVRMLLKEAEQMARLVSDLGDVRQMELGRFSVEVVPAVSPVALIQSAVTSARAGIGRRVLRARLARRLPCVRADEGRVLQVLSNLLGNAVKFTPPGGTITIRATQAANRDAVLFSVSDTGIGMSRTDQLHASDLFWQANHGGRRGSGLGLTICKGIIEAHGGSISVTSRPGQGSTFSFALPVAVSGRLRQGSRGRRVGSAARPRS